MKHTRYALIGMVLLVAGCCLLGTDPAAPLGLNPWPGELSVLIDGSEIERGLEAGKSVSMHAIALGGSPPYSYEWRLGEGSVGELTGTTSSSAQFRSQVVGTANVIVTVTDSVGATASDSRGIDVTVTGPRD